jgi:hypothetical protein
MEAPALFVAAPPVAGEVLGAALERLGSSNKANFVEHLSLHQSQSLTLPR